MQLLRTQPAARLTVAQALRHPFFAARLPLRHLWSTQAAIVPSADAAVQVTASQHHIDGAFHDRQTVCNGFAARYRCA